MLYLERDRKIYPLILLPGMLVGLLAIFFAPFEIVWTGTDLGWSYRFLFPYMVLFYIAQSGYTLAIIVTAYRLRAISKQLFIRRKYLTILLAFGIFHVGGMALTNTALYFRPDLPVFGGVLTTLEFLFIAYAVYLPVGEIKRLPGVNGPMTKLSDAYLEMLNKLRGIIPGKELSVNAIRFDQYVEAMGLGGIVYVDEGQELVFDSEKFRAGDIGQIMDTVLRVLRQIPNVKDLGQLVSNAFVQTYEILKSKSKIDANEWLNSMLHVHGGFLWAYSILDDLPHQLKVPKILKELLPGRVYLFKEETPAQAYNRLKEALNYGFECLCISKLHPQKVRERYDVRKASILWLSFKEAEKPIKPTDLGKLRKTISEFVTRTDGSIVLLDCFDQIKFANGFQKSLTILKELRSVRAADRSTMLMSIDPRMFEEGQLEAIEKELEEAKTE